MKKSVKHKFQYLLFFLLSMPAFIFASAQDIRVNIDFTKASLGSVLNEIGRQTSLSIVYNTGDVNPTQPVSIKASNENITTVMNRLLRGTGLSYSIMNKHLILSTTDKNHSIQQEKVTVTGNISDAKGEPLIGVSILVKGTSNGTITDMNGHFSLPVAKGDVIEISYIGYAPQAITVTDSKPLKIVMKEDAEVLDEVVVTALGIKRAQKALSYNVQQVGGDAINTVKDANFINSLQGKVAGVTINNSAGGVGSASRVVMRGTKSITKDNNALYVIDGIPMFNVSFGKSEGSFATQSGSDGVADLNPDDIESINMLTGPSAAALYGNAAANGVVLINTKKGSAEKTTLTVSNNTMFSDAYMMPEMQNRYGNNPGEFASWGNKTKQSYDPSRFFNTGVNVINAISFSTGTKKNQTYASASTTNATGILPNNSYSRYNFSIRNTATFLKDRLTLDVGASYIIQNDKNITAQGQYFNPLPALYLFPRGDDWADIEMYERYDPIDKISKQYWPMGDGSITMQNPYWANYRNLRENRKDRYMLNAALSYDILDWLNVSGRIRIDNSHNTYTEKMYASSNVQLTEQSANGLYGVTKTMDRQVYGDALLNINKTFGDDWSLQANIGASFSDMKNDALKIRGPIADGTSGEKQGLANVFNIQNLSNSTKTVRKQEGWREQTQSIFASAEVGYKGTYYLTLTGRNDWPSQLAGPHSNAKSFFYPSVGLSVVLSQLIPNMPENLSYIKLRGSFASVGVAFERYIANPLYSWNESGLSWNTQTQYPAYHLKPERTKSFEVGLTMRFLKHFNLDFTYYNSHTSNQTFDPQISGGTGFSKIIIQSGNVRNQGIELALGYRNTWRDFTWDTNYTLSTNQNKIISLANNVINYATGERFSIDRLNMGGLGDAQFLLQEGGTLGDLYSRRDLRYDENNAIYIDENGNVATETIQDVNKYVKLGSVLPDVNMSWRNDFRWKNLNFGFMISARLGGIVYSRTQAMLDQYGVSEVTAAARDAGGVTLNGGDVVDAYTWYSAIAGGNSIPQFYTYSATNVRLQEASIGYTIPRKLLRNVCEITVSIVGRNLWMLYNKAPFDPESIATTGNYYQGIDYFMMPSLRNVGFNLRLKF